MQGLKTGRDVLMYNLMYRACEETETKRETHLEPHLKEMKSAKLSQIWLFTSASSLSRINHYHQQVSVLPPSRSCVLTHVYLAVGGRHVRNGGLLFCLVVFNEEFPFTRFFIFLLQSHPCIFAQNMLHFKIALKLTAFT